MALAEVKSEISKSSKGNPLPNNDHKTGIVFYGNVASTLLTSTDNKRLFLEPKDAADIGIDYSYSDEVRAVCTITCTAFGEVGHSFSVSITDFSGTTILGSYTNDASIVSNALAATAAANSINALTFKHGYTATAAAAVVTITAAKGKGVALNTIAPSVNTTGAIAYSRTAFNGGVGSVKAVWYYHIERFFAKNPRGYLHVGIYPVPSSTYDFNEVENLQLYFNGALRQIGVYADSRNTLAATDINALQTTLTRCDANNYPLDSVYACNIFSLVNIQTLPNLNTVNAPDVMVNIDTDASGKGWELFNTVGKNISNIGAILGTLSASKVSESIAWVGKYNFADGINHEKLMFGNGQKWENVTNSTKNILDDYKYVFLRKFISSETISGSFINRNYTAVNESEYINRQNLSRVIKKVKRGLREKYLPQLSSPIQLNSNGTLTATDVAYLEGLGNEFVEQMKRDSELSDGKCIIDPTQNIKATKKLIVVVKLVEIATAEEILLKIGFDTF